MRRMNWAGILRTVILWLALATAATSAQAQSWPSATTWIPVRSNTWGALRDVTGDMSPPNADISSHGWFKGLTVGDMDSVLMYSDGTYLYFRWLLSGNPVVYNNSAATWQIDSRNSYLVVMDTNNDNVQDLAVTVSKSNAVMIFQGISSVPIRNVPLGRITPSGTPAVYNEIGGLVRVTDLGFKNVNWDATNPENLHYLDLRIPFAWLPGLTANSFVRPYFGTSNNDNNINKDFVVGTARGVQFGDVAAVPLGDPNKPGALYDSRDPAPSTSGGTWRSGETVLITGYGWPAGASVPVRIFTPDGQTQVWAGTITADASGNLPATSSWLVPVGARGIYRIYATYPSGSPLTQYDTFTVVAPVVAATKTVNRATASAADILIYTITYGNSGDDDARNLVITDAVPANTTFVAGTVTGTGATITYSHDGGQTYNSSSAAPVTHVRWTFASVAAGTSNQTVSFQARVTGAVADQAQVSNVASVGGDNIVALTTNTVNTTVNQPVLTLTKSVDRASAQPGDVLTYTLTYRNAGQANALSIVFTDQVPANTTYVRGSASGAGATIEYQHVAGGPFDTSDAPPVIAIRWTIPGPLAGGASGTVSFKATIR